MKILVLSDSHSGMSFMRLSVEKVRPDAVVHLGDHFDDGHALQEEFPHLRFYQVPGNCDKYRAPVWAREILCLQVGGVTLYMTHGHRHFVKQTLITFLRDARAAGADAALYGHTHIADCHQEADGLWVLNPGSCGYFGGSAGLMEVEDGRIVSCRLLTDSDLMPV